MENTMDEVHSRVSENFDEVRRELSERTQELRDTIASFVDERPLQAVGIAFAAGYLLSGALFSRTTARIAGLGGRVMVGGLVRQLIAGIGPGMLLAAIMGGRGAGADETGATPSGNGGER
jgi:hypothetical protein